MKNEKQRKSRNLLDKKCLTFIILDVIIVTITCLSGALTEFGYFTCTIFDLLVCSFLIFTIDQFLELKEVTKMDGISFIKEIGKLMFL